MADPMEILAEEHRNVECVLDGLEAMATAAEVGAFTDAGKMQDIIWFLREVTDGKHHLKEEELLFPVLELRGFPRTGGPTATMRLEHERGRELVSLIARLLGAGQTEAEPDWREVALAAQAYVRLLRAHIEKENHCVFQAADEILGPTEKDALAAAFQRVNRDWAGRNGEGAIWREAQILQMCRKYVAGLWTNRSQQS